MAGDSGASASERWFEKAWPLVDEWQATRTGSIEADPDFQRATGRTEGDPIYELEIRFEYVRDIASSGQSFSDWRAAVRKKRATSQENAETLDWLMEVGPLIEEESRTEEPTKLHELQARIEYESEHRDSGLSFQEWKTKTEKRGDVELKEQEIAELRGELNAKDDEIDALRSQITACQREVRMSDQALQTWQHFAFWWCVLLDLAVTVLLCWPAYSLYSASFWIAIGLGVAANLWMGWVSRAS